MPRVSAADRNLSDLAEPAHFKVQELAALSGLSVRQLERITKRKFSMPPQKWLDIARLNASLPLLRKIRCVKIVGLELGFKHTSHFCRKFKAQFLVTPSEFILSNASGVQNVAHR